MAIGLGKGAVEKKTVEEDADREKAAPEKDEPHSVDTSDDSAK